MVTARFCFPIDNHMWLCVGRSPPTKTIEVLWDWWKKE